MKKVIFSILFTSSLLLANTTQDAFKQDMRVMLQSMTDMQKAGFYNNVEFLKRSAKRLTTRLDSLLTLDASTYLSNNHKYPQKFAEKRAKMIKMYTEDLLISLDAGNMDDALEDYNQIMRQCTSCHTRLRK